MLIIERRTGESIHIGDEIRICVLDSDGECVRIGVTTPREVSVTAVNEKPTTPTLVEQQVTPSAPKAEQESGADLEGDDCEKTRGFTK